MAREVDSWSAEYGESYYSDIKIIGVGGGGCNVIEHMISDQEMVKRPVGMATFIAMDTDAKALGKSNAATKLLLGENLINGIGCGCDPRRGRDAAKSDLEALRSMLIGTELVFIVSSLGGGTGTGVTPVLAEMLHEMEIATVVLVSLPCSFEGAQRANYATVGKAKLIKQVPTIVIPNDQFLGDGVTPMGAFAAVNDRILEAIRALAELINPDSTLICTEINDVLLKMNMGMASEVGIGYSNEYNRSEIAARKAIDELNLDSKNRHKTLNAITYTLAFNPIESNFTMDEFSTVSNTINSYLSEFDDVRMILGQYFDFRMTDGMRVTAIASYSNPVELFLKDFSSK